jgi:3-phenylpropionate/trans-cinnamate dioxygenase ferredoxin component
VTETSTWQRVCALADLPEEGAVRVWLGDQPVCVARSRGEIFALHDVCSHAEVALSDGEVEDGTVECWLHGSRFDLRTGKPTGLPATKSVGTYETSIDGDDVLVSMESSPPEKNRHWRSHS